MGTLFSALSIARSGLQTAQVQLDTAGHNIANVNKEGFSRQRVELTSNVPISRTFGQIGRGVQIAAISRVRDVLLDGLLRNQAAGLKSAEIQAEFFTQIEDVFLEPSENGLSGRLNLFFEALQDFSTNVESLPVRQSVVTEADALASLFNQTFTRLDNLRTNANEEVINFAPEINSLAEQIAALNDQIRVSEGGSGNPANDLRDDRDLLLDQLAEIGNIFVREKTSGEVDVLIGEQELVSGSIFRTVEAVQNPALDPNRNDFVELRFTDNGQVLTVQDGELYGALQMRDQELPGVVNDINQLAATIIQEINQIHSQANGLVNLTGTVTGSISVPDATVPLTTANIPFPITAGSFEVNVYDATDTPVGGSPFTVTIGAGTSLNDVVADLNAIPNLSATVTPDGQLQVTGAPGFSFSFSNDTSGAVGALGVNGLFTGFNAQTMGVNQAIAADPQLLAGGFSTDPLNTGDNTAALAMADVQNQKFFLNGSGTINDFYESVVVQVGVDARSNESTLEVEQTFVENFERRRQEISGVSIDEEVTLLIQFQRAFEASARVVTVTDRMLDSLLAMAL